MPRGRKPTATPQRKPSTPSSTTTKATSHKREPSGTPLSATSGPGSGSRQSKRLRSSLGNSSPATRVAGETKTTPKKSKYFQPDSESEDAENDEDESPTEAGTSGYEDASAQSSSSDDDDPSASDFSTPKPKPKPRRKSAPTKTTPPSATAAASASASAQKKGQELWRTGVKTGLGPGKQVFIERPKARGDGGVKYVGERIHPNTMAFLADLGRNNEREWMKMHDADYRASKSDWDSFVEALTEKIIEKDDTIPELPPKDLPYFSAAWSRTGRKGPYAGYYVQIKPGGGSFVGAGLWMPEAAPLAALRTAVDHHPQRIKKVLTEAKMRKEILGGVSNDEGKAVKAFVGQNTENALKTKPKGYEADHPNISLLRLRNFTLGKKLADDEVLGSGALERIAGIVDVLVPFKQVTHLNQIVMPDEDAASASEESDEDE
ncbi:MAG: hypothetical protein Q9227_006412 [Pyrenula ochraceoflavens]